jgi:hypothetical protein
MPAPAVSASIATARQPIPGVSICFSGLSAKHTTHPLGMQRFKRMLFVSVSRWDAKLCSFDCSREAAILVRTLVFITGGQRVASENLEFAGRFSTTVRAIRDSLREAVHACSASFRDHRLHLGQQDILFKGVLCGYGLCWPVGGYLAVVDSPSQLVEAYAIAAEAAFQCWPKSIRRRSTIVFTSRCFSFSSVALPTPGRRSTGSGNKNGSISSGCMTKGPSGFFPVRSNLREEFVRRYAC